MLMYIAIATYVLTFLNLGAAILVQTRLRKTYD